MQKYVPGIGEGASDVQKYVPKSDLGAHFEVQSGGYSGDDVRMEEQSHNTELENYMEESNRNDLKVEMVGSVVRDVELVDIVVGGVEMVDPVVRGVELVDPEVGGVKNWGT